MLRARCGQTAGRSILSFAASMLVSSPKQQVVEQEKTTLSCARGSLVWILGRISSIKELSSSGTGYSGKWLSHHPRRYLNAMYIWHLWTWLSGGLMVGIDGLKGLFQVKWLYGSVILKLCVQYHCRYGLNTGHGMLQLSKACSITQRSF